jgi:hypothetical protein
MTREILDVEPSLHVRSRAVIDLSTVSHISAERLEALPPVADDALARPLEGFFGAGYEDGLDNFCDRVAALPGYLGRLPAQWREVAYEWIGVWVEPSVPSDEARPVLAAAATLRPLLTADQVLPAARRLLERLPTATDEGAVEPAAASEEAIADAGRWVAELARERLFDDVSVRAVLMYAERLRGLPFAAVSPHISELLEAVRQAWYAQGLREINDAFLEILATAPSAETLAAVLGAELERIDPKVRGYVVDFLRELQQGAPHLAPDSVPLRGLAIAIRAAAG